MAKKEKKQPQGAPDWMVTYGDMMTLLLCFFVILVSMSEIKENQRFHDVNESIKKAFGYQGGIGKMPGNVSPANSLKKKLTQLIMKKYQLKEGKSSDQGIEGESPSVRKIREGLEYIIGGQVSFELGKAKLLDPAKKQLDVFVEDIRGMNNKIRIRGHTARIPPVQYLPFANLDDLSYARGTAVRKYLVSRGIRDRRITIEVCSDKEPLRTQAYEENSRAANDRVSIIVTENLVEDYQGSPASDSRDILDR